MYGIGHLVVFLKMIIRNQVIVKIFFKKNMSLKKLKIEKMRVFPTP